MQGPWANRHSYQASPSKDLEITPEAKGKGLNSLQAKLLTTQNNKCQNQGSS